MCDPSEPWAKALGATGEASKEAIRAVREFGRFVGRALEPVVDMAAEQFEVWKSERRMKLAESYSKRLKERGLSQATRKVAPAFLIPLLECASLEDDDDLQAIWATMLANAADAGSDTERRIAFITMLKDMTVFDVRILAMIHKCEPLTGDDMIYTGNFPDSDSQEDQGNRPGLMREDVKVSLGNLARLGCISPGIGVGPDGPLTFAHVRLTALGAAFIRSCTYQECE